MVMSRGVSLTDLEQGGTRPPGFDTNTVFSKKKNKVNIYFVIGGILVALLIIGLIIYSIKQVNSRSAFLTQKRLRFTPPAHGSFSTFLPAAIRA